MMLRRTISLVVAIACDGSKHVKEARHVASVLFSPEVVTAKKEAFVCTRAAIAGGGE